MYEVFEKLLKKHGIKTADVSRATGLSSTFFTEWKKGKSKTPKIENLKKIADYFNVSVDYLMTGKEVEFSTDSALLDAKISKDFELKSAIQKYYALNDEKRKAILRLIDLLSEDAK